MGLNIKFTLKIGGEMSVRSCKQRIQHRGGICAQLHEIPQSLHMNTGVCWDFVN